MEQVALDAKISRAGLYFLFSSKEALFSEAVERSLQEDLTAVERALANSDAPLRRRLLQAFDHWAGRYIGPLTRDVAAVVEGNPDLLGPAARAAPLRFAHLVVDALSTHQDRVSAQRVAQTLISTSIGIKHQVDDRREYLQRLGVAVDLLLPAGGIDDS
jgi:AcrR family transcriptional regulator